MDVITFGYKINQSIVGNCFNPDNIAGTEFPLRFALDFYFAYLIIWLSNHLTLNIPDEGYSPHAESSISPLFFQDVPVICGQNGQNMVHVLKTVVMVNKGGTEQENVSLGFNVLMPWSNMHRPTVILVFVCMNQ